jgi:hypothetical protein
VTTSGECFTVLRQYVFGLANSFIDTYSMGLENNRRLMPLFCWNGACMMVREVETYLKKLHLFLRPGSLTGKHC